MYLSANAPIDKEISIRLKRHRSTLYRELNRNKEYGVYLPSMLVKKHLKELIMFEEVNYKKMDIYEIMLSGH